MPAVAKKSVAAKAPSKEKVVKKQSLKKTQKTESIKAAKKLAKLQSKKAISDKLNRAPVVQQQKNKHRFDPVKLNRGVVLVHNLPHGFYEEQLEKYFSQFGEVTRLRVGRSEKTGGSRGYAFIEFKYPAVAEVAAEALNNYLMFRHILKTVYIPPDKQTHNYFRQPVQFQTLRDGTKKLITPTLQRAERHVDKINEPVTDEQNAYRAHHSKMKIAAMEKKLAAVGIKVDLSSVLYDPNPAKVDKKKKKEQNANETVKSDKKKAKKNAKEEVKGKKSSKGKENADKEAKTAGAKKNNGNSTLENLLENTIQSSDEESDDDDYEPTPEEVAEADAYVQKLLLGEESDGEESDGIAIYGAEDDDDDGGDDEDDVELEFEDEEDSDNSEDDENDNTLTRLVNNTIDSDEEDSDEDFAPAKKGNADAESKAKANALAAAKKVALTKESQKVVSDKKKAPPAVNIKSKNAKVPMKAAVATSAPKSSQKRKLTAVDESQQKQKKKKETNAGAFVVEPVTPPPKVRKNFVTAPTPTPPPKKAQKKSKLELEKGSKAAAAPVQPKKGSKAAAAPVHTPIQPKQPKSVKKGKNVVESPASLSIDSSTAKQSKLAKNNKNVGAKPTPETAPVKSVPVIAQKQVAKKSKNAGELKVEKAADGAKKKKVAVDLKPIAKTAPPNVKQNAKKVNAAGTPVKVKPAKPVKKIKSK